MIGRSTRGAAHLDAAAGIGAGQERFRPRRVIAIGEGFLGAIDRDGFGIGGEARHADLQFLVLFARTLEECPPAPDRGTDRASQGIRPGVAGDAHGGLDLVEAEGDGSGGIGGQLQRVVLGVGDMALIAGGLPRAHLREGEGKLDRLYLISNTFVTTMTQQPTVKQLLPVVTEDEDKLQKMWDYLYEPSAGELLDGLLMRYVESQVYQGTVENVAAEMAARMVAMKAATDNAGKLIGELQLIYNKARQASITKELSEIVGGAAAV